jgi:transposase-like protein
MSDDPARPLCPTCRQGVTTLIATLKDARTIDIYLCQDCRTQFSYERSQTVDRGDVQRTDRAVDVSAR